MAFVQLVDGMHARRYGIEIDAYRSEQARNLGIETVQASAFDVRSPAEAFSLLYLNPPYDLETGATNNQRLEFVFRHLPLAEAGRGAGIHHSSASIAGLARF